MMFGEVPLAEAEGAVLAHSVMLDGRRVPKGTLVDSALIATAAAAGLGQLWVARIEAGDVPEDTAATAIGAELAGAGVEARAAVHGRVNLHARHDGLLHLDAESIIDVNATSEAVGIATLPPNTPVRAGDLLATVKIIPFALDADVVRHVLAEQPTLEVRPWRDIGPIQLIQTRLPDTQPKQLARTSSVMRDRVSRFGWSLIEADPVSHSVDSLAAAMAAARNSCGLILVAGAAATADRRDVVPTALVKAGGEVVRFGMPVDPGNLMVLGEFRHGPILIGLPGCAKSPKRNGLDLVLEQLAANNRISAWAIDAMGVGGLLEGSGVPVPWAWRP